MTALDPDVVRSIEHVFDAWDEALGAKDLDAATAIRWTSSR